MEWVEATENGCTVLRAHGTLGVWHICNGGGSLGSTQWHMRFFPHGTLEEYYLGGPVSREEAIAYLEESERTETTIAEIVGEEQPARYAWAKNGRK